MSEGFQNENVDGTVVAKAIDGGSANHPLQSESAAVLNAAKKIHFDDLATCQTGQTRLQLNSAPEFRIAYYCK